MKHRLLSGLAVASLTVATLAVGPAGPAGAASGAVDTARDRRPVAVEMAAEVSRPARQAADSVALLAGAMVVGASAAFAGTGMVRRRKVRR